jgi:tRNA threonylcarbamoyladenosine biosynthesis protein TsaE
MATFISNSPADTLQLGEQIGKALPAGAVIGLDGDLGAGKTQFVKGLARGLGVTEPVLSPTFALLHIYTSGRLPVYHIDFYRLDEHAQIIGAGLAEYLEPDGVAVIEWCDRWKGEWPKNFRRFHFENLEENQRRISYDDPRS